MNKYELLKAYLEGIFNKDTNWAAISKVNLEAFLKKIEDECT